MTRRNCVRRLAEFPSPYRLRQVDKSITFHQSYRAAALEGSLEGVRDEIENNLFLHLPADICRAMEFFRLDESAIPARSQTARKFEARSRVIVQVDFFAVWLDTTSFNS